MSNNPLPQAYLFSNVGVFDSNNGVDFVTGVDDLGVIQTAYANSFGMVTVVSPNSVFIGNTSWKISITAPSPAQIAAGYVLLANGAWGPAGSNGAGAAGGPNNSIQFSNSGVLAGDSLFTYNAAVVTLGNSTVFATLNSTAWSGSANSASFIGTLPEANVVSNAQLIANLANYTTTAGLPAVIAVNTANNTSFVGSVSAANVVSNAQLIANLANYVLTSALVTYVQNTDSRVLSGNLQFSGANVTFGNSTVFASVNSTFFSQTANNTSFVGAVSAANVVSNAQLIANLANYVLTSALVTYVQNTDSRTLSGNLNFTGANVAFSPTTTVTVGNSTVNTTVNSTSFAINGVALSGLSGAVRYDTSQSLTTGQAGQARANITASLQKRTQTILTSGSGTYTTPANCIAIYIFAVGGGGGGGGGGVSGSTVGGSGGAGANTTFTNANTSVAMVATGGNGGPGGASGAASGTAATGGDVNLTGTPGMPAAGSGYGNLPAPVGGNGGNSTLGGGGYGLWAGNPGSAAATNSGSGGGGGCGPATGVAGAGGVSGATCIKLISSPASAYSYVVGAGGTGGTAGTSGGAGGAGGSGLIMIEEFY